MNDAAEVGCLLSHVSVFFSSVEAQVLDWLNYHSYNMALAVCLGGAVESIYVGNKIATDMLGDTKAEITCDLKGLYRLLCTKVLA